jgi:hypothetical protein
MTTGKKLTIALAIAIPLLVVGTGLAMAASEAPDLSIGKTEAAPAFALAQVATSPAVSSTCGDCTGQCDGDELCDGECTGLNSCGGSCYGSGTCTGSGTCVGFNEQCVGAGRCGGATSNGTSRGCGQRVNASAGTGTACPSCDVVGLDQYPTYSPKYSANV